MTAARADEAVLPREAEALLTWLAIERGRSPNTLSAYRRDLLAYGSWLGERRCTVGDVAPADVAHYVAALRADGKAASSVARAIVVVRSLHRFMVDEGMAELDPTADLDAPRVPASIPKALTEEEVERLLDSVVGAGPLPLRDRAMLELLYGTGIRVSELVGLSLSDVDLDAGLVRAFGKGAKERIVPLGRPASRAMAEWLDDPGRGAVTPERWARRGDAEAIFLSARGRRITRQGAWLVVKAHGERVGLGAKLSPHVLRHSCATHMLDHGADIRAVQELLGHASISTTQVYTKVSTERLWRAYDAAHPRSGRRAL
ncbi:MAG: site-specific tyrosine recombinase [Acidimicrobiales bacterium]